MWLFSRGIPRCDPGQCPVWDEPEAGSSLPCRQVRASDEGARLQNVSRCLLLSYSCFVVLPKLYSCLVFLSQLKTSEPGLQVRLRPGDKGPGRQPAGRLVQRIISMCYIWIMLYNMHILLGGFANFVQLLLMLIFMTQVVSSPWPTMASRSWRRDGASLRTSRFLLDLAIWVTNILGNY